MHLLSPLSFYFTCLFSLPLLIFVLLGWNCLSSWERWIMDQCFPTCGLSIFLLSGLWTVSFIKLKILVLPWKMRHSSVMVPKGFQKFQESRTLLLPMRAPSSEGPRGLSLCSWRGCPRVPSAFTFLCFLSCGWDLVALESHKVLNTVFLLILSESHTMYFDHIYPTLF